MTSDYEQQYQSQYRARSPKDQRHHDPRSRDPYAGCVVRHAPAEVLEQAPEYVPATRRSCIVRTSTLDPEFIAANASIVNDSVRLLVDHDLNSISRNWSPSETEAERRLVKVEFKRVSPSEYFVRFVRVSREDFETVSPIISCIYWKENDTHIVTSVDVILILESFVRESFTIEEKNRIRRNLQSLKPYTISRANSAFKRFFNLLMSMENPRPRNIEQDLKVFKWDLLFQALGKVISKYSVLDCAPDTEAVAAQVSNIAVMPLRPAAPPASSIPRSLQASPPLYTGQARRALSFSGSDHLQVHPSFPRHINSHGGWSSAGAGGDMARFGGAYAINMTPYQRESIRLLRPKTIDTAARSLGVFNYHDMAGQYHHTGSRKGSSPSIAESHGVAGVAVLAQTPSLGLGVCALESEPRPGSAAALHPGPLEPALDSDHPEQALYSLQTRPQRPGSFLFGVTQVSVAMSPSQTLAGEMTMTPFEVAAGEGAAGGDSGKRTTRPRATNLDLFYSNSGEGPVRTQVRHGGHETPLAATSHNLFTSSSSAALTKLPSIVENLNDPYLGPYQSTTLPPLISGNLPGRRQSMDSPQPREIGDFLRERQHTESHRRKY